MLVGKVMDFLHDQNCSTLLPSAKSPCTARKTCCLPHGRGPYGPPPPVFSVYFLFLCRSQSSSLGVAACSQSPVVATRVGHPRLSIGNPLSRGPTVTNDRPTLHRYPSRLNLRCTNLIQGSGNGSVGFRGESSSDLSRPRQAPSQRPSNEDSMLLDLDSKNNTTSAAGFREAGGYRISQEQALKRFEYQAQCPGGLNLAEARLKHHR